MSGQGPRALLDAMRSMPRAPYDTATREEMRGDIDRLSRELLGLSGEEFLTQWKAGKLDDFQPKVSRLALLARLMSD